MNCNFFSSKQMYYKHVGTEEVDVEMFQILHFYGHFKIP